MADADRPGGSGREGAERGLTARLRVFRGGGRPRRGLPRAPLVPGEVADRLAALERQVEEALVGSDARDDREFLVSVVDGTLAAVARAQRWAPAEALARLRAVDWAGWMVEPGRRVAPWADATARAAYRYWWRVETVGVERVPADGPVVLVANRSGALLPYEALMIALALEAAPPGRIGARFVVDDWLLRLPVLGAALIERGAVRATPGAVRRLLARAAAVIAFPEGPAAVAKPFRSRYRLAPFVEEGFARAAIQTGAPIVPVAVIGAEETHPVLARADALGRLVGLPTLPLTATFPWLGAAGLLPLPTKWVVHFGEPLEVAGRYGPDEAGRAAPVRQLRDQVRERVQALVLEGLRRRRAIFRRS